MEVLCLLDRAILNTQQQLPHKACLEQKCEGGGRLAGERGAVNRSGRGMKGIVKMIIMTMTQSITIIRITV